MVGHYYATLISEESSDILYIAIHEGKTDDGTYKRDNFMRVREGNNLNWKHPPKLHLIVKLKGMECI